MMLPKTQYIALKVFFLSLFLITSSSGVSHAASPSWIKSSNVKASDVVAYLMQNKYCDKIEPPIDNPYTKKEFDSNWSRTCNLKLKKVKGSKFPVPIMQLHISTGKSFIFDKNPYEIYGVNWSILFSSFESSYPGSFNYAYRSMNTLAKTLGARAAGVPIPSDFCFYVWGPDNESDNSKVMVQWKKECDAVDAKLNIKELMDPPW